MCSSTHINQKETYVSVCYRKDAFPRVCLFEPLTSEPQVAEELAKGTKEKTQTQRDEEHGERKDDNRRHALPSISSNRSPCCTT